MPRQNIVLITCHDLGTHLGCYGVESVNSPNLDRLAAESARFDNYFCTAPQCSPSRASICTGRYPHSNGMFGLAHAPFFWSLHPTERHLAQILKDHGYRTALAGVQHVTREPAALGFERTEAGGRPCEEVAASAIACLADLAGGPEPFYLEVGFFEPHRPFDYGGAEPDDTKGVQLPGYLPDNEPCRRELAALQGAVRKVDDAIGRLVAALDATGKRGETILVFTTDHGIAMPRAKCTLYDPGIRTALLVRAPMLSGRPAVQEALTSNVDLLPTLLAAVGVPIPAAVQGRSFLGLLTGEAGEGREHVFVEKTFHNVYDPMRGVRSARYKYVRNFEANPAVDVPSDVQRGPTYPTVLAECVGRKHPETELYDLEEDPWEHNNVSGKAAYADVERDLAEALAAWMRETGDPLLEGPIRSRYYERSIEAVR